LGKSLTQPAKKSKPHPVAEVGLTRDLRAGLLAHNKGQVPSTKRRVPLELIYWEGCLNESDAAQREKYLKSAWGKRYIKGRLRRYLTG
jgi:putative endonuclease